MKAVGYKVPGPIAEDASLVDIDLPRPVAEGGDILVEVKAVSVNPVDYKIRSSTPPADGDWKVLGVGPLDRLSGVDGNAAKRPRK